MCQQNEVVQLCNSSYFINFSRGLICGIPRVCMQNWKIKEFHEKC